jgi:transcriptional regulator of arginine metabolism
LPEVVVDVLASGKLVVVRTYPGMASTVGAAIDAAELHGVIGTVAGDDTLLVVAAERTTGRALAKTIKALADRTTTKERVSR